MPISTAEMNLFCLCYSKNKLNHLAAARIRIFFTPINHERQRISCSALAGSKTLDPDALTHITSELSENSGSHQKVRSEIHSRH